MLIVVLTEPTLTIIHNWRSGTETRGVYDCILEEVYSAAHCHRHKDLLT